MNSKDLEQIGLNFIYVGLALVVGAFLLALTL